MNFIEAVKAMKECKKVRRSGWSKDSGYNDFNVYQASTITLLDIEATDWEVVEEKKTLSDKIFTGKRCLACGAAIDQKDFLKEGDVKEALKELISRHPYNPEYIEEIREIFGEGLLK